MEGECWSTQKITKSIWWQNDLGLSKKATEYTHIDVCGGGQWAVRAVPPKIITVDIYKKYQGREYLLLKYKHDDYDSKIRYKVAFWAATNVNVPYDILGVLKFRIPFIFHSRNAYFCSENGLWSLQKEIPSAFNSMKPYNCVPGHFYDSEEIEIVESGIIE